MRGEPDGRTRSDAFWQKAHDPDPSWREEAACRTMPPDVFFGVERAGSGGDQRGGGVHVAHAKAVCRQCPVIDRCLSFALGLGDVEGVFGGTSQAERRRIRRGGVRRV